MRPSDENDFKWVQPRGGRYVLCKENRKGLGMILMRRKIYTTNRSNGHGSGERNYQVIAIASLIMIYKRKKGKKK